MRCCDEEKSVDNLVRVGIDNLLGIRSCGLRRGKTPGHVHKWSMTYTEDAEKGNHYQICEGCDEKKYNDHKFDENGDCVCGKHEGPVHTHAYYLQTIDDLYLKSEATCTEKAVYYKSCECGEKGTETFEYGEFAPHTEEPIPAVDATCTKAGLTEGLRCSVCKEVLKEQETIFALGHDVYRQDGHPATCTEAGFYPYELCSRCDYTTYEEIPATGHTEEIDPAIAGDCTHAGLSEVKHCFVCNEVLVAQKAVGEAPGHLYENNVCTVCKMHIPSEGLEYRQYNFDTGYTTYSVVGIGSCTDTAIYIPDVYNGKDVTSIESGAFNECHLLTRVEIPDNITKIESDAFSRCSALTIYCEAKAKPNDWAIFWNDTCPVVWNKKENDVAEDGYIYTVFNGVRYALKDNVAMVVGQPRNIKIATIPASVTYQEKSYTVTSILQLAFSECTLLTDLTISDTVTSVSQDAFNNCLIEYATIPANACKAIYNENGKLKTLVITSGESIEEDVFSNCKYLASVIVSDSVTSIGDGAFSYCSSLATVTVGNGVTSMGGFYECPIVNATIPAIACSYINNEKLSTVVITSGESIEENAFSNCKNLASITIPESVTSIGDSAFQGCRSLVSVMIPESITSIGSRAFNGCSSLTGIKIPDKVTRIEDSTFSKCSFLKNVTLPDNLTNIGWWAFNGCSMLTSIVIPDKVTSIEGGAFLDCGMLANLTIGKGVTTIGERAFDNCLIENVQMPTLAIYAISHEMLKTIAFTSGEYIEEGAFSYSTQLTSVTVCASVTRIEQNAFYKCCSLTSFIVDENNANYKSIDGNLYSKDGTTLIQYAIGKTAESFTIPDGVNDIGELAFYVCSTLKSVTIPNSVKNIGNRAFAECSALTNVSLGNGVESVGYGTFSECGSLTSVTVPASLTDIGNSMFGQCSSLTSVTIENGVTNIGRNMFAYCSKLASITIPESVTKIENGAFEACTSLTSVTLENEATSFGYDDVFLACPIENATIPMSAIYYIPHNALKTVVVTGGEKGNYSNCFYSTTLTDVTLKGGVTNIENNMFANCPGLTSVTIEDGVKNIGTHAFAGCGLLASITIPDSVTSIEDRAFRLCASLASVTIGKGVKTIGEGVFYACDSLTSITIPSGVTRIRENVFADCSKLESVAISESVTSIGKGTFSGCVALTSITVDEKNEYYKSVEGNLYNKAGTMLIQYAIAKPETSFTIPSGVKWIQGYSFENCILTSIVIPDSVTDIDAYAFCNCSALTNVTMGSGVFNIGDYAFLNCEALTGLTLGNKLNKIGYGAFSGCSSLTNITIPDHVDIIANGVFARCSKLTYISVGENNTEYKSVDGHLYNKDGTMLIQYAVGQGGSSFTVPEGVTVIGQRAFEGCDALTRVALPNGLTMIGDYTFKDCSALLSVDIPASVTIIGEYAFMGCSALLSLDIPASVTYFGKNAFSGCSAITSIIIPNGVKIIYNNAFSDCSSLTSIVIPGSVTEIVSNVFSGCGKLETICFEGTEEEFDAITVYDTGNDAFASATKYYYSETNPFEGENAVSSGNYWHYGANNEILVWAK